MEIAASYQFPAPPTLVWGLLTDPDVIASCLPGCERLEPLGEDRYRATLKLTVAAIGGSYTGTVAMLDKQAPRSYRLSVEGSGRPGFVNGGATIELAEHENGTLVKVTGTAEVGGLIASVGQRLIGSVSKMMMDRFFACLQGKLSA